MPVPAKELQFYLPTGQKAVEPTRLHLIFSGVGEGKRVLWGGKHPFLSPSSSEKKWAQKYQLYFQIPLWHHTQGSYTPRSHCGFPSPAWVGSLEVHCTPISHRSYTTDGLPSRARSSFGEHSSSLRDEAVTPLLNFVMGFGKEDARIWS